MRLARFLFLSVLLCAAVGVPLRAQPSPTANPAQLPQRDGSHDFDFLIGDWKAHVRRLPDRLNNSNTWVVYDGISNHHKLLDSNANFEQFDVTSTDKKLHIKAQTLRMYNPATHQWPSDTFQSEPCSDMDFWPPVPARSGLYSGQTPAPGPTMPSS
jgi:hypothetical protein